MKLRTTVSFFVCLAIVLSFSFPLFAQSARPDLGRFEKDVREYAWRSIDDPPIPGGTLFVGSSSFKIWGKKLEAVFADRDAVNRGFGGSQISHNIIALDRIHLPYRPSRIVIFCGGNDLAAKKDVETVFADFRYYIARHWNENPSAEIGYVSVHLAPVREKNWEQTKQLNAKVRELASKVPGLFYIDILTPSCDENGRPLEHLFAKDRLHLNDDGYAIWAETFKKAFDAQDKAATQRDIRELFRIRKSLGLFDDPRFAEEKIAIKEPPAADRKLNIVFIGDSITIGGGEKSPPNRCKEYLEKQDGIASVTISNQGVSGLTTVDFLPSKEKRFPKVAEAADAFKDDKTAALIFSIMLGTNDSAVRGPDGAPVSPEDYRKNLREIVDKLLADYPDSKVVLHRPVWYSDTTQNRSTYLLEGQLRVAAYAPEIKNLVDYYALTSQSGRVFLGDTKAFYYFKAHYKEAMRHESGEKGTFFLHPNDRGADVLGRFWGAAILDAVK